MEDKILTYEQIKALFPNEWVLLGLSEPGLTAPKKGVVLFHSKDYLELCYKGSEIAKGAYRYHVQRREREKCDHQFRSGVIKWNV